MRKLYTIFIISLLLLNSCSKIIPAKFWENYRTKNIVTEFSDHGPWGGTTKISWKTNDDIFKNSDILKFAEKNNWKISDSLDIEDGKLKTSKKNFSIEIIQREKLINSDFSNGKIYIFKTEMLTIKPDTSIHTQENGFLLLNNSKNKMLMFNNWGE